MIFMQSTTVDITVVNIQTHEFSQESNLRTGKGI